MARQAIMVDVDGVIVAHPDAQGWSAGLQRDLGLSAAALQDAFFKPHWNDVILGRAAMRERLAPVLTELSPLLTGQDLIDYWFRNDAQLNHDLPDELARLRRDGFEVHLATVQEHERAVYLWDQLDLRSRFDGMHYAAALRAAKPSAEFYRRIEARTGRHSDAIFFIDDREDNVSGARACGWTAALWTGKETLHTLLSQHSWSVR